MTSLEEFTRRAATRYLQNIVFVDDEIYDKPTGRPVSTSASLPAFKSPFASRAAEKKQEVAPEAVTDTVPYHPKQLVESFAQEGMVCALYEPSANFDTSRDSVVFKLCERADAVIFDWDLFGEDGRNIMSLLGNLVDDSQNSVPHHVRLCVIYTTKPDLERVANAIYEHLNKAGLEIEPVQRPLRLLAGATRIIVLGKPDVPGRTEQARALEVREQDLAARVIEEFARMNSGILPSYALHGMSSVRRNSRKILDKFHGDMDGAFLLHRALIIGSEDAFDQLPDLLAEEVLAVISDEQLLPADMEEIARSTAGTLPLNLPRLNLKRVADRPARTDEDLVRQFLGGGEPAVENEFKFDKYGVPVEVLHTAMGCTESRAEKKLAALFGLRTKYFKGKRPALGFGTIVRYAERRENGEPDAMIYAFCLMPICDSIRLKQGVQTSFPFWRLKPVRKNENGKGIVVLTRENAYLDLMAAGKPRDMLSLHKFQAEDSGIVIALKDGNAFYFKGENITLEWVAQLKPAHAQRIANDIGQSFSRVGLAEAEWLRMLTG